MRINFIVDEEISLSNGNDILKTEVYANTLSEVVSNSPKDKVFTIGLFGGWGTGKSSIIKTVREKMETSKVKFITYDARKYANDSFRRMFLLKIQEELKYEQTEEMQRFYQSETAETEPKTYISKHGLWAVLLILLIILVVINLLPIEDLLKIACSSIVSLLGLLVTVYNGVFQKLKVQISKPHLFAPEQFEHCFNEMTSAAFKQDNCIVKALKYVKLLPQSATGIEKLVIIIDNIDRCHSEMAYQLLTDIKTFLSDEKKNVVFIIPVDDEALKQNLFDRHGKDQDCSREKEEFLRKFFNVTIRIKPHQFTELNTFAKALNNKYNLGFNENTVALCSKEFATNPRRIIQLFNNLASELSLYPEDFAKKNESMICIILILREEYYDFYQDIVNDSTKLRYYKPKDEREQQNAFMRIADPIIRKADMSDVLRILTNSDAIFDGIPTNIKDGIVSYATKETIEYINAHPESTEVVLDLIKRNVKEDIKSQSDAQLVNSIEFISAISCSISIPKPFLIEIDYLFKFYRILEMIDKQNWDNICHFALLLDHNDLPEFKRTILSYIVNSKTNNKKVDNQIIKVALRTFQTKKDCETLNAFIIELFKTKGIFKDVDYSKEQKEIFFSNDLIQYFINKITIGENMETHEILWLLKNRPNIEVDCYSKLFEKLNNLIGNPTNKNKDQMFTIVKYASDLISLIPDHSSVALPEDLNTKLWKRTINNRQIYILEEHNSEPENCHFIIDLFLKIYRINDGLITNEQVKKMIFSDKQYVYSKLIELKEQKYNLEPFWNDILVDNDYDANIELLFPLIEFCILQKDNNGEFAIDKDKIKKKVTSLCDNISNPEITKLIERLIKDNNIKPFFIEVITAKDSSYINSLPNSLLELAINSFNQENFSQFAKNTGFLSVIASKGTDEQKTEIVKMMTENINKKNNLDDTFNVLDCIVLKKSYNKDMLRSALQAYKDSDPNDSRADALITKFEK